MSTRHLDRLLTPTSVAVIGASDRPSSVGATVWRNLRAGTFAGSVHPVNLRHATIDGHAAFARPADLPQVPDLAVLCTPPATVPGLVDELARLGTRAAIVVSAGLDAVQRQAMLDAARPHRMRLLGPNCLGLLTPRLGLNASFAHTDALAGDMAFVSQSGALVTAVLDWAKARRIGFSHLVSMGEHADVDVGDLLDHLASDAATRSILLYLESIDAPRKFMSAARAAARNKPVIVVKAGRAGKGVQAAASHTGALAGSDVVSDAAIRRAGMLRVDTLQQLFSAAETLAHLGHNRDAALTLMTNGGGPGVMAADAAALRGVQLHRLDGPLLAGLERSLPPTWSHANPIDIIGDAPVERYVATLRALVEDRDCGTVFFLHAPTAIVRSDDIAKACAPLVRQAPGRVMACWLGAAAVADARRIFQDAGAADFETPEEAIEAFAMLQTYRRNQEMLLEVPTASEGGAPDPAAARRLVDAALAGATLSLDEFAAKSLLAACGIPVVETRAVGASATAATAAAAEVGYPVALKIRSPDILHKSDVGGVRLGLRDAAEVERASVDMLARVRALRPAARVEGFTVQRMAVRPFAQELIVGAAIDPVLGPVVLFGQGGTAVEVVADRAVGLPPLNRVLARDLIDRTRVSRLLAGYRDRPPARLDAVCDVLVAVSQMLVDLPELAELDINPLWADEDGVVALDARVRLSPTRPAGAARFAIAPYPDGLVRSVAWEGESIVVRPIRPEDEPRHRRFLDDLEPDDLRLRFHGMRMHMPHTELARLTQIDYDREMAFIAIRQPADGTSQTLGVARAVVDPDNVEAEFAIVVRSDLKRHGLGSLLTRTVLDHLVSRGTQRVVALVLRENLPMRRLAAAHGFKVDAAGSDAEVLRFVLALPPPAAASPAETAPG